MGESSCSQDSPWSSLRKMPASVPAMTRLGLLGYTVTARTVLSVGTGLWIWFQDEPPSELTFRPPPTVPTNIVKSCAIALTPLGGPNVAPSRSGDDCRTNA